MFTIAWEKVYGIVVDDCTIGVWNWSISWPKTTWKWERTLIFFKKILFSQKFGQTKLKTAKQHWCYIWSLLCDRCRQLATWSCQRAQPFVWFISLFSRWLTFKMFTFHVVSSLHYVLIIASYYHLPTYTLIRNKTGLRDEVENGEMHLRTN